MSELAVFSHLRWAFVWQRPQHVISRLAAAHRHTWFVEEPLVADVDAPVVRTADHGPVTRVWLEVPGPERHVEFSDDAAWAYATRLRDVMGRADDRMSWLYTPLAYDLARALGYDLLVYDVMDDLASFKGAPAGLRLAQSAVLGAADVVFAGGRSLHKSVRSGRPDAHLLPSGVEPQHYAVERTPRAPGHTPVAGYVGVIDERIDLELVARLSAELPDWEVRMVGPVAKIDPAVLPVAENITYPGPRAYEDLPQVMSEFDVALMPFALNQATRSISPTKTLEYLAAGLPVVSTRVPDVVADFGSVIHLAAGGPAFARACREALEAGIQLRDDVAALLRLRDWDTIAARMKRALEDARPAVRRDALGVAARQRA